MRNLLKPKQLVSLGFILVLSGCSSSGGPSDVSGIAGDGEVTVQNAGFEQEWSQWIEIDEDGKGTAISDEAHSGNHSAKVTKEGGQFEQVVTVKPGSDYQLQAVVKGAGQIGVVVGSESFTAEVGDNGDTWTPVSVPFNSADASEVKIFGTYNWAEGRFDDFEVTAN